MIKRPIALIWILALVFGGCGGTGPTTSYNAENNQTRYRTGTMTVLQGSSGGNFASQTSIVMRATARCNGQDCTPDDARLVFSLQGQSDIALSDRTVSIVADGEEMEWGEDESWERVNESGTVSGRVASITMSMEKLSEIANASSLEGTLGDRSLNLGGVQSRLQDFVQTAQNPTGTQSDAS